MKKIFLITLLIIFLIFIGSASANEDSNLTDDGLNLKEPPESIVIEKNTTFDENNVEIVIAEEIYLGNYESKIEDWEGDWYIDSAYAAFPNDANGTITIKVNNSTYKTLDVCNDSKMDTWYKYTDKKVVYCYFDNLKSGLYYIDVPTLEITVH